MADADSVRWSMGADPSTSVWGFVANASWQTLGVGSNGEASALGAPSRTCCVEDQHGPATSERQMANTGDAGSGDENRLMGGSSATRAVRSGRRQ